MAGPVVECFVCRKHRTPGLMPGGAVGGDDLVVVSHISPEAPGSSGSEVLLGRLIVEPYRHAPGLIDLTDLEAQRLGLWAAAAARALTAVVGAERVHSAVIGYRVPHLHQHVFPRYPGTPAEYPWDRLDEWPGAPRGDAVAAAELVGRLREYLVAEQR